MELEMSHGGARAHEALSPVSGIFGKALKWPPRARATASLLQRGFPLSPKYPPDDEPFDCF